MRTLFVRVPFLSISLFSLFAGTYLHELLRKDSIEENFSNLGEFIVLEAHKDF